MQRKKGILIKKVKEWVLLADEDLRLAKHALGLKSSCPYRLIAYHAQQCAEKYLKAFLVYKNIDFPYTHNISLLLELCSPYGGWTLELEAAKDLTAYAITTRYPGQDRVTKKEALRSVDIAFNLRKVLRKVLKEEGINLK